MPADASNYAALGASATKHELHAAIAGGDAGLYPTAFCKLVPDALTGDPAWCAALHADGTGTKSALAYLLYRETGDASVFAGLAQDAIVMNLDDLLCVGATGPFLLSNTIGRNGRRVPTVGIKAIIDGMNDFAARMAPFGIEILPTGGETADLGDVVRTLVVDVTLACRMRRDAVVDAGNIAVGDAIVGFASYGQATYEDQPNSGIGSNGLTLARHLLLKHDYYERYPETVAPETDPRIAYRGRFALDDMPTGLGMSIGAALASPTRTFAPLVKRLLEELGKDVHGLIHNTGGAFGKCLRFGRNIHFVKDAVPAAPPLFSLLAAEGELPPEELARTFNMGVRLEAYVPPAIVPQVLAIAKSFGIDAWQIGNCESSAGGNRVTVKAPWGTAEIS